MAQDNIIKIRRGLEANLPAANTEVGEPRYSTDLKRLYIDDGFNDVMIASALSASGINPAVQAVLDLKSDLVGSTERIIQSIDITDWTKYGAGTDSIVFSSGDSRQVRAVDGNGVNAQAFYRRRVQIPPDFVSFQPSGIRITTKKTGDVDNMNISLYKNGVVDTGINNASILPAVSGVYAFYKFTPSGSYSGYDQIIFEINIVVDLAESASLSDFEVRYNA